MTTPKAKTKIDQLEDNLLELIGVVEGIAERVSVLEKGTVKKPQAKFGEHRGRVATKDTTTGVVYVSKSAVGKALAAEADTDPFDHFAWYKLTKKFPDRFVDASAEEKAKVEAEEKARVDAEVAEANKQIAAKAAAGESS